MRFKNGGKGGPGRPKGLQNKVTTTLKESILGALSDVGGRRYLAEQARKNPAQFMGLLGRVLPLQVKQDGEEPMVPAVVQHIFETSSGKTERQYLAAGEQPAVIDALPLEPAPVEHEAAPSQDSTQGWGFRLPRA
jgi:hypothetical protein